MFYRKSPKNAPKIIDYIWNLWNQLSRSSWALVLKSGWMHLPAEHWQPCTNVQFKNMPLLIHKPINYGFANCYKIRTQEAKFCCHLLYLKQETFEEKWNYSLQLVPGGQDFLPVLLIILSPSPETWNTVQIQQKLELTYKFSLIIPSSLFKYCFPLLVSKFLFQEWRICALFTSTSQYITMN